MAAPMVVTRRGDDAHQAAPDAQHHAQQSVCQAEEPATVGDQTLDLDREAAEGGETTQEPGAQAKS
jgi:hypothetical protein